MSHNEHMGVQLLANRTFVREKWVLDGDQFSSKQLNMSLMGWIYEQKIDISA